MTKLLFGRVFGIGNAVMSVPAIKHYRDTPGYEVTVMVGTTPDDTGAYDILRMLEGVRVVTDIEHFSSHDFYDIGVMSIPYDGRWNGMGHAMRCKEITDGRPRPDPSTFGFSSWKLHEAEYQLLMAEIVTGRRSLEYQLYAESDESLVLDSSFWYDREGVYQVWEDDYVYLGVGYKRDAAGFWSKKHWGDQNFLEFTKLVLENHPEQRVQMTGNVADVSSTGQFIRANLPVELRSRFIARVLPMHQSMKVIACANSYVGNDTGMMHVAASMGKPVAAFFNFEGTEVKNHPLLPKEKYEILRGWMDEEAPKRMYAAWLSVV